METTYGYQSRRDGTLDEAYGFETMIEAVEHSMLHEDGWNTIILIDTGDSDYQEIITL